MIDSGDCFRISNFPLPPSENNVYSNVRGRGRVPNAKMKEWWRDVQIWELMNLPTIKGVRRWMDGHSFFHIDIDFLFHYSRIISKAGKPKINDCANRLKPIHDSLAKILMIDDCAFFQISAKKIGIASRFNQGSNITLYKIEPETML